MVYIILCCHRLSQALNMKLLLLNLCLVIVFSSCAEKRNELAVKALPIDGKIVGNILSGSSVLNDSDRFVWGASVIKGKDDKYHMLYATWECGDSIPQFSDSWVLHSKIAYAVSDYPDRDFEFQKIVLRGRESEGDSAACSRGTQLVDRLINAEKGYLSTAGVDIPAPMPPGALVLRR